MNEDLSSSKPPSGAPPQRTTGGNMRWTPPSPEHMARMLPQYDRWQMLGHGGMGAVYQARQPKLDRLVAIKILPPEAADDEAQFIERFKNEARTMAKLDHPAIVAVYDFGETSEGQLYFVMAYVDGTDVSKMIHEQGKLPAEHALAITAHVCDALQYAHTHGVIHRDIKPANVLINHEGAVKVTDFGLAKMEDPSHSVGLTKSGMSMGTPDFVAPESLTLGMVADHRADLYAVGVMLYQMLTGRIPRGMPQPPSVLVPGVDPRFDAIVGRAMEHDREARWQSAREIRHALDQILTVPLVKPGDTVSSAAIPRQAVAQKPVARGPQRPGGAGAAASWSAAAATPLSPGQASPPSTKAPVLPLVLGVLAVLAVGAWFFLKPKPEVARHSDVGNASPPALNPTSESRATPPASPVTVAKTPPAPAKPEPPKPAASSPKKEDPKPVVTTPPAAPTGTTTSPVPAKAVSPVVPPSATALQDAPAPPPTPSSNSHLPSPAAKLPAELTTLDTQFQQLQTERVTAPFETDAAKLNTGYLGAVDREMAKEKAAGHLDDILALEAEKKVVTASSRQPSAGGRQDAVTTAAVPESDEEKTPASLKALRSTYRAAYAKLIATRASNLKALTEPLEKRLAQMEADFTKADRVADAKTVRAYRDALAEAQSSPGLQPVIASQTSSSTAPPSDGLKPWATLNPAATSRSRTATPTASA